MPYVEPYHEAVVSVPPGTMQGEAAVVRLVATLQGDETISATVVDTTTTGLLQTSRPYRLEPGLHFFGGGDPSGEPQHAVDADGRLVGVLLSGGGENINFLVPIQRACVTVRACP